MIISQQNSFVNNKNRTRYVGGTYRARVFELTKNEKNEFRGGYMKNQEIAKLNYGVVLYCNYMIPHIYCDFCKKT